MSDNGEWDVIHTYTRKQAIEDGVLVDVSELGYQAGFRWPVAMTSASYEDCVAWSEEDNERKGTHQDVKGRLWDVLWMAYNAAKRSTGSELFFEVARVPREGKTRQARKVRLRAVAGPGDNIEPVVTIMHPHED